MKKMSVKARVTAWIAMFSILIAGIAFAVIFQFVSKSVWHEAETVLREAVEDFEEEIEIMSNGGYEIDEDSYHEDQVIFSIYDNNGEFLSGSVPSAFPLNTVLKNGVIQKIKAGEKMYLTYDVAINYGEDEYLWLRGILYTSLISNAEKQLILIAAIVMPLLVCVAIGGGYLITKRAFQPIEDICITAAGIAESGDLSERVVIKNSGSEFQKLAQFFNRMLDSVENAMEKEKQFTADASHELRTPISVIVSESEYGILPDLNENERKESLEVVLSQAKKMSAIISQMLSMTRNDGRLLVSEKIELGELVEVVCDDLAVKAARKKIRISLEKADCNFILGDPTGIIRIFTNLIENAIQYGDLEGHVWIRIFKENGMVKCEIKDDGIGIAKEHLDKIFHRFFRVDKTRTSDEDVHTGLGLPMVKMLVENHQGNISVSSELGIGTTFIVSFPQEIDEK